MKHRQCIVVHGCYSESLSVVSRVHVAFFSFLGPGLKRQITPRVGWNLEEVQVASLMVSDVAGVLSVEGKRHRLCEMMVVDRRLCVSGLCSFTLHQMPMWRVSVHVSNTRVLNIA